MILMPIWWVVLIVAAILLFLLPFFVFRIRNELIELNRIQWRMLVLLEAVVPESKKPATKTCATCRTVNPASAHSCSHCGEKFVRTAPPSAGKSVITKENKIPVKICTKCEHRNEPLATKCRKCGAEI